MADRAGTAEPTPLDDDPNQDPTRNPSPDATGLPEDLPAVLDVVVIGAGPGGTAAAIEATRRGLRVVVVDKATFPRDKCCGDGLTTGALRNLEELGLDPATVASWQPVDQIHLRSPAGRERAFPLPDNGLFAVVARRAELDQALVDLARDAGAVIAEGHELTGVELATADPSSNGNRNGDGVTGADAAVTVTVRGPDGERRLDARYVVAADGMWSPTRKLLGLTEGSYRGEWHAFRHYMTGVDGPAATELLVWFEKDLLPGYAWSFPLAGGAANVGFGVLRDQGRSGKDLKELWPELLRRPHVVEALGPSATPEGPHRAWPIPARLGRLPVTEGPVLFVGDALADADPMTGEGIGQAIETGREAVQAIAEHLNDPDQATAAYRQTLARGMVRDHGLARALGRVLASPFGTEAALATAGATGWTRRNFARWLFEDYPRAALGTPRRWHRRLFTSPGAYRSGA